MTKKLLLIVVVLLAATTAAIAADGIAGKWVMEQAGRGGGMPGMTVTYEFKVEGSKLTGTVKFPGFGDMEAPPPAPISNGKIEGNTISFDVTREMMGNSFTQKYEGVLNGDQLTIKQVSGVAKRAQ
jgi:opacity protein-like surface antigen